MIHEGLVIIHLKDIPPSPLQACLSAPEVRLISNTTEANEELSSIGATYTASLATGLNNPDVFASISRKGYTQPYHQGFAPNAAISGKVRRHGPEPYPLVMHTAVTADVNKRRIST